ncbi:hypothetical protein TNCV_3321611 [Trichonephila clavipes]|nr:hypothetical protein TNCV_3321611 [Trichonephila clavipes]
MDSLHDCKLSTLPLYELHDLGLIVMRGRRSPRYNCSFYICPVYRKRISKEFGGASGQRTLWRAKLYPCTACWPIGIVKFTARTLKRMIFRVVQSPFIRVGARTLGAFYSLLRLPEKLSHTFTLETLSYNLNPGFELDSAGLRVATMIHSLFQS